MKRAMSDSLKGKESGTAVLSTTRTNSDEVLRLGVPSFSARCKSVVESLAVELLIQLCVLLLLATITIQLMLDTQMLAVPNAVPTCSNQSSPASPGNPLLFGTFSVTAQFQYVITALSILFFLECAARLLLVRTQLLVSKCSMLVNVLDMVTCVAFSISSITLTVLTYNRVISTTTSFVDQQFAVTRDCVNYIVIFRLVRVALIVSGTTNRGHRELCEALTTKRDECTYLTNHAERLKRRLAELEAISKALPAILPSSASGLINTSDVSTQDLLDDRLQSASTATMQQVPNGVANYSNRAFESDSLRDEINRSSEDDKNMDYQHLAAMYLASDGRNVKAQNANQEAHSDSETQVSNNDGETEGGELTPEAEAVIQRLYELGLEWEMDQNDTSAVTDSIGIGSHSHVEDCVHAGADVDVKTKVSSAKLPGYFANMPTTTL